MSNESIGISNLEINKFIKNSINDDLESNFIGVNPSDKINFFIIFHNLMRKKDKFFFIISNTDRSDRPGMHW